MILWIFEIGYFLQHAAIIFQILNVMKKKSTEGVAIETVYCFLIGSMCRFVWMWDSMLANFYLAYLELIIGFASLIFLIYLYHQHKMNDYLLAEVKLPFWLQFPALIATICVLSFFFHPGTKNKYYLSLQMFVSLNIFCECVGLLPQLYLIKNTKETGNLSEYYIIFLGIARVFRLLFWFKMYSDGNSFISLILADICHTVLLSIFVYTFKNNRSSFAMPTFADDSSQSQSRKKIF
jgi:ER lumen protein retaining receptor